MDDPLKGLELPYPVDAPAAPAAPAASTVTAAPDVHPALRGIDLPYTAAPAATPQPVVAAKPPSWTDVLWGDTSPEANTLQPRSLSQVGRDIYNFGRVAGNQAGVPHALDRAIAASAPWTGAGNYDYQAAQTENADSQLSPAASAIAKFMGQRASVARALPYGSNPIVQGIATGGGGTLMQGDTSPFDYLKNIGLDTGASALGEAAGTYASAAAKAVSDRSARAISEAAQNAANAARKAGDLTGWANAASRSAGSAALEDLRGLYKRGGDIAGRAEDLATQATGAAQDAYHNIAQAANASTTPGLLGRSVSTAAGYMTPLSWFAPYVLDPVNRAVNTATKNLNVRNAIDQAYPPVAGAVKTAVDPQAWRDAFQNLVVSNSDRASDVYNAGIGAVRNFKVPWGQ